MILIENQRDAVIARLPRIEKEVPARRFKMRSVLIAQEIQRPSQRHPPALVPTRFASGVTTTIANPPTDAVGATPGGAFAVRAVIYFNFKCRWMLIEIFSVVGDLKTTRRCFDFEGVRQTNIAELEVMAIGFAVGRDSYQLSATASLHKSIH